MQLNGSIVVIDVVNVDGCFLSGNKVDLKGNFNDVHFYKNRLT